MRTVSLAIPSTNFNGTGCGEFFANLSASRRAEATSAGVDAGSAAMAISFLILLSMDFQSPADLMSPSGQTIKTGTLIFTACLMV